MRNSGNIVAQVVRPSPLVGEGCAGLASASEPSLRILLPQGEKGIHRIEAPL
jgi:hypothetical protein